MKHIISFALCLSMLVSMLPVGVFAAESPETVPETTAAAETFPEAETEVPEEEATSESAETEIPVEASTPDPSDAASEPAEQETEMPTEPEEAAPEEKADASSEAELGSAAPEEGTEPQVETAVVSTVSAVPEMALPSEEELFSGYANTVLGLGQPAAIDVFAGDFLTGDLKLAYNALLPLIREIANGQRDSAVLSIGHRLDNVSVNGVIYNCIPDVEVPFTGSSFVYEDLVRLVNALLHDMPYELYWMDKVTGYSVQPVITSRGKMFLTFSFHVSANYSATGQKGTYDLNTAITGAATAAADSAAAIAAEYADKNDYDKMNAYKDRICQLTSYNNNAASNPYWPYGDPWQIIYVFDNDPDTQVVCEGYAKAFQYLCGLSTFQGEISCLTVTGDMVYNGSGGAHMWNVVSIDGKNYLVDVTNCDGGFRLFLGGTEPESDGSYTLDGINFTYDERTTSQFSASLLTLENTYYSPASPSVPSVPNPDTPVLSLADYWDPETKEYVITGNVTMAGTIDVGSNVLYVRGGSLTVPAGQTLEVQSSGGSIEFNTGALVVNGTLNLPGSIFLCNGSTAAINGTLNNYGSLHVGFVGSGYVSVSSTGSLNTCGGYLNICPGGTVESANGLTVGPDDAENYGFIQVDGTLRVTAGRLTVAYGGPGNGGICVNTGGTLEIAESVDVASVADGSVAAFDILNSRVQWHEALWKKMFAEYLVTAEEQLLEAIRFIPTFYEISVTVVQDMELTSGAGFFGNSSLTVAEETTLTVSGGDLAMDGTALTVHGSLKIADGAALIVVNKASVSLFGTADNEGAAHIGLDNEGSLWIAPGAVWNNYGYLNIPAEGYVFTEGTLNNKVAFVDENTGSFIDLYGTLLVTGTLNHVGLLGIEGELLLEGGALNCTDGFWVNGTLYASDSSVLTVTDADISPDSVVYIENSSMTASGVLTSSGTFLLAVGSRLTVTESGCILAYQPLCAYDKGAIVNNSGYAFPWYVPGTALEQFRIVCDADSISVNEPVSIQSAYAPAHAQVLGYYCEILEGNGQFLIDEEYFASGIIVSPAYPICVVSRENSALTVRLTPVLDYDENECAVLSALSDTLTLQAKVPLTILTQPTDASALSGSPVTVTVEAQGSGLTYQWYYRNPNGTEFLLVPSFDGPEYTITMSQSRSGRQVYCVITDQYGNSLQTNTVTLTMLVPELKIMTQPADMAVKPGETAAVTVDATGDGLTYEWYYKNPGMTAFSRTTAFDGPEYSITMSQSRSGRQVYCVITDQYGRTVTTNTVTLSMILPELKILTQPADVTVAPGETASVSLEASGEGLTYEWYYKNSGSSKFSRTTAFDGPTYSITMSRSRHGRQVYCIITDQYGRSLQTDTVTLRMQVTELRILHQPESVTVESGKTARVSFQVQGDELTYRWYYKNPKSTKFSRTTAFDGPEYFVTMSQSRHGRQVYCVITDAYGNSVTTDTVSLNMVVTELAILQQPTDVSVYSGETAKVTVEAQGDGLTYKWYYKNPTATRFTLTTSFEEPEYFVTMSTARSGRQVYCLITDQYGNSAKSETVTLNMIRRDLEIVKQPEDVAVPSGKRAEVTVTAVGDDLTYEWYFKNAGSGTFSKTTSFTGNRYYISMSAARSGRQVYCIITDGDGNAIQTDTVTLSMVKAELAITRQPKSVSAARGKTAKVTLEAEGEGLTYTWYYKNPGSSKFSKTTAFTGPSYSVTMTSSRSGRQVYCVVTDAEGNSIRTNTVTLSMK